jgi:hypothetical protein
MTILLYIIRFKQPQHTDFEFIDSTTFSILLQNLFKPPENMQVALGYESVKTHVQNLLLLLLFLVEPQAILSFKQPKSPRPIRPILLPPTCSVSALT